MFLNNVAGKAWTCLIFWMLTISSVHAGQRTIALLIGDVESRPAVHAVRALQEPLRAHDVAVRIIPVNRVTPEDRAALAGADVVVLNVLGRQIEQSIGKELESLHAAGRPVFAIGSAVGQSLLDLGVREDRTVQSYHRAGGVENLTNLLRHLLQKELGLDVPVGPVRQMPEVGLYDVAANRTAASFEEYQRGYAAYRPGAPWVGVMFYRASLVSGQTLPLSAIVGQLEARGYNVAPVFGYPYAVPLRYFLDESDKPRVSLIVALGMKVGGTGETGAILEGIGVPAINAITLSRQSAEEWAESKVGLDIIERTWQLAGPELAGLIQPTVVASRERVTDAETGLDYIEEQPIADRVERLAARVDAWTALQRTATAQKRVALLYYNYPHGSETIGAAYLNVLPESLWQIVQRLRAEGYGESAQRPAPSSKEALQADIQRWGSYPSRNKTQYMRDLGRLAQSGEALLVPLADYRRWYAQLPLALRKSVEEAWGPPEQAHGLWRAQLGDQPQFVFPARRYGNLLLAPQPARAWEQHLEKLHNEVVLPPSHAYIAFYLWLQQNFKANALIHLGTHGTHEWLSGKEAGLSEADPSEALIGAMPNIYPYVMDDVGEGLQAKRRGMATIIDHMTPPFDKAGLNPDLRELGALMNDYRVAEQKSPLLAQGHLTALNRLAGKSGVLKDLGRKSISGEAGMEALEEYLDEVATKLTPFGLHTFGVAPSSELRDATARAIVSLDPGIPAEQQASRVQQLDQQIVASASNELDSLVQALAGRYVPGGPGADLLRNPAALPSGRNFYGLDPARIPSQTTYELGAKLADQLISDYRARHGVYPDKLTINLWGVETSRHEGIMEAQVLALLGVRPTWDKRGRVTGVEAISRSELRRPRVDVTMVSSGLFRDLFSNLLQLLDSAAQLAQEQDDSDNPLRLHTQRLAASLQQRGLSADQAQELASTRIFGLPSGGYGTNIDKLIPLSNVWKNEQEIADVFINRMSHPFGHGNWGDADALGKGQGDLRREVFRQALSGSRMVLHSRSSNLFSTLDNDDFFQYLGGSALAIRSVDGKTPEVMVTDLSNPRRPRHATLEKYMGQELQSRYLNPRWADSMLKEGYAGARFINRVVDHLWAWQVTVPEAVDASKWQRMYETYVADRHGLRVRERFETAGNLAAFQSMTDRMLSAIELGYWKPSAAVHAHLKRENVRAIADAGVTCSTDSCSRETLRQAPMIEAAGNAPRANPSAAPSAAPAPSVAETSPAPVPAQKSPEPDPAERPATPEPAEAAPEQVSGYEMEALNTFTAAEKTIGSLVLLLLAFAMAGFGYWRQGRVRRSPL